MVPHCIQQNSPHAPLEPRGAGGVVPAAFALLLAALSGCSRSDAFPEIGSQVSVPGPHGGHALPLPEEKGYIEILVERVPGSQTAGRASLVAYLLQNDARTPMPNAPGSLEAMLTIPIQSDPIPVSLTPQGSGGKYASAPGDFDYDELRGEFIIPLEGRSFTVPFLRP